MGKSTKNVNDRIVAQVVLWRTNWKRYGEGTDPELYERGYDDRKREPSWTPRPEKRLNFNGE